MDHCLLHSCVLPFGTCIPEVLNATRRYRLYGSHTSAVVMNLGMGPENYDPISFVSTQPRLCILALLWFHKIRTLRIWILPHLLAIINKKKMF
jgi:hypothetical protein